MFPPQGEIPPTLLTPSKEIIYTRWLRVYKDSMWRGPTLTLWLPFAHSSLREFRLNIRAFGYDVIVDRIPRQRWRVVRPQHIAGFEFDHPRPVTIDPDE